MTFAELKVGDRFRWLGLRGAGDSLIKTSATQFRNLVTGGIVGVSERRSASFGGYYMSSDPVKLEPAALIENLLAEGGSPQRDWCDKPGQVTAYLASHPEIASHIKVTRFDPVGFDAEVDGRPERFDCPFNFGAFEEQIAISAGKHDEYLDGALPV